MLRIGMLQMTPAEGLDAAGDKADRFCRDAKARGADIVVFPEMWSQGYRKFGADDHRARQRFFDAAQPMDGAYVARFQRLAAELELAILVTLVERHPAGPRNAAVLLDRHGRPVLQYAKVHTCGFHALEACCSRGDGFSVAPLDTAVGPVAVGVMICIDREQPESARCLMLRGAELILVPNACHLDDMRLQQVAVRAFENATAIAVANYAQPHMNGRSLAVDAEGRTLVEAAGDEGTVEATLDLDALRAHRARTIWGNAWRQPDRYADLIRPEVTPPFVRTDALGRPVTAAAES